VRAHTRPRRRRSPTGVPLGMAWHSLHGLRALGGGRSASCLTNDGIAFRTFCSAVASLSLFLCLSVCVCVIRAGLVHVRVSIGRCQGRPPRGDTRLQSSAEHRPAQEGATANTATRLVYIFQAARSNQSLGTENSTRRRKKRERERETEKKHVKEYVFTTKQRNVKTKEGLLYQVIFPQFYTSLR
jgi:hypothetical protein